mmetsp:Transcript_7206/g.11661  ORF Transcript_7206/g.11661 Transcript_7206/m.11661 type:complete len:216 (-) Transcript_7206:183-830(-)
MMMKTLTASNQRDGYRPLFIDIMRLYTGSHVEFKWGSAHDMDNISTCHGVKVRKKGGSRPLCEQPPIIPISEAFCLTTSGTSKPVCFNVVVDLPTPEPLQISKFNPPARSGQLHAHVAISEVLCVANSGDSLANPTQKTGPRPGSLINCFHVSNAMQWDARVSSLTHSNVGTLTPEIVQIFKFNCGSWAMKPSPGPRRRHRQWLNIYTSDVVKFF